MAELFGECAHAGATLDERIEAAACLLCLEDPEHLRRALRDVGMHLVNAAGESGKCSVELHIVAAGKCLVADPGRSLLEVPLLDGTTLEITWGEVRSALATQGLHMVSVADKAALEAAPRVRFSKSELELQSVVFAVERARLELEAEIRRLREENRRLLGASKLLEGEA